MNTPNKLTLLRILIAPFFMYFFLLDTFYWRLVSVALFMVAALTDLADGYYARRYGIVTGFGKFMDPLADKVLVSSALISFVALGYVSPLPVMLIVGREFLITGVRLLAAYRGVVIMPSPWAKVKTFSQMTVVGLVLVYITLMKSLQYFNSPPAGLLEFDYVFVFNLLLWLTAVLTVWTGISYVVRYFYMIRTVLR
ncbi:MAG: CDP-diacylglycerol--glycerol-3-phosphate 3-phosphatidyltransferase [Candidatus Zixiibacteriota bacterium]